MDKDKRENFKTMILFALMFFGINYAIYTFVMMPKELDVAGVKEAFVQVDANKTIYEMKEQEKNYLEEQILEIEGISLIYNDLIMEKFDTINMTVDVYNYMKQYEVDGKFIRYEINDIIKGSTLAENVVEEVEVDINDPNYDSTLVVEQIEQVEDEVLYRVAKMDLEVEMDKEKLKPFLENLNLISKQNTYFKSISITANSESINSELLEDERETELILADGVGTEADLSPADQGELDKQEFLTVIIQFESYIVDGGKVSVDALEYDFYEKSDGYDNVSDLFETPSF